MSTCGSFLRRVSPNHITAKHNEVRSPCGSFLRQLSPNHITAKHTHTHTHTHTHARLHTLLRFVWLLLLHLLCILKMNVISFPTSWPSVHSLPSKFYTVVVVKISMLVRNREVLEDPLVYLTWNWSAPLLVFVSLLPNRKLDEAMTFWLVFERCPSLIYADYPNWSFSSCRPLSPRDFQGYFLKLDPHDIFLYLC